MGSDPHEASRAAFGDAVVADVGAVVEQLLDRLPAERYRAAPPDPPDRRRADARRGAVPRGRRVRGARPLPSRPRCRWSTSRRPTRSQFWAHLDRSRPRSLFFPAAGGLGFGLPAAVGVALADPARPVVAVLGDGALQYGVTGLWTAAQLRLPVTFLVLRNGGYEGLRGFLAAAGRHRCPRAGPAGPRRRADRRRLRRAGPSASPPVEELAAALRDAATADGPRLLEVPIEREVRVLG